MRRTASVARATTAVKRKRPTWHSAQVGRWFAPGSDAKSHSVNAPSASDPCTVSRCGPPVTQRVRLNRFLSSHQHRTVETILLTPLLQGGLPPRFFLAAGVATGGVVLLVGGPGLRTPSVGDALMLAAAVVRAAHVTLSGRLSRPSYDTVTLTTLQTVVGAVVFTVAAGPALLPAATGFAAAQWLGVLYLALGCSVFAFVVQLWAVRRTSAARASLLLGTEPVWAVLIGVSLGGEHLTVLAGAGIALVLAGTFGGQRVERAHRSGRPEVRKVLASGRVS